MKTIVFAFVYLIANMCCLTTHGFGIELNVGSPLYPKQVAFGNNGTSLIAGDRKGVITHLDTKTGEIQILGKTGGIHGLEIFDGYFVAMTESETCKARLEKWDILTGDLLGTYCNENYLSWPANGVKAKASSMIVFKANTSPRSLVIFDTNGWQVKSELPLTNGARGSHWEISPSGHYLVTSSTSVNTPRPSRVEVWDIQGEPKLLSVKVGVPGQYMRFSADEATISFAAKYPKDFDAETCAEIRRTDNLEDLVSAMPPDFSCFWAVDVAQNVEGTWLLLRERPRAEPEPDGLEFIEISDSFSKIFEVPQSFGNLGYVNATAFSADNRYFAFGDYRDQFTIVDLETGLFRKDSILPQ